MKTLIACAIALSSAVPVAAQKSIDYRFEEVRRKVVVTAAKQESRAVRGNFAHGGDQVATGWFSYALIASERHRARFEIFSNTAVILAEGTPGVLLSVERGRIRAAFDKMTGSEPRIVKTPGALLAVRGTEFDVEVSAKGETTVDVYEGIVEVRSMMTREPMLVGAGQQTTYARNHGPSVRPIPEGRRRHGPDARNGEAPARRESP